MMELDKEMALYCLGFAKAAYTKDYANINSTAIQEFIDLNTDTEGFTAVVSDQTMVIAFTGSESVKDWINNARVLRTPYPSVTQNEDIKVHYGFYTGYLLVRQQIHEEFKNKQPERLIATGHSLGGALATLCALDIQYNFFPDNPEQVACYTFGSPKVGNQAFADSYNQRVPQTYRIINGGDGVTWLPRPWQGYVHVDTPFTIDGNLLLRIVSFSVADDHKLLAYQESLNAL